MDNSDPKPPISDAHSVTKQSRHHIQKSYTNSFVANIFFDGTYNNVINTMFENFYNSIDVYSEGISNIARMYLFLYSNYDPGVTSTTYIDGIGTDRNQDDSLNGGATGRGDTGVYTRAIGAFDAILQDVVKSNYSKVPPRIEINVYGFSRGAAAARYFVYLANVERKRFKRLRYSKIIINFIGIFDTVASIFPGDDDSNVADFHLKFNNNYAYKVFHLVAGDEIRANFPLTNIYSALNLANTKNEHVGAQLVIPGAHSDVGGGYKKNEKEIKYVDEEYYDFILKKGWFSEENKVSEGPIIFDYFYLLERKVESDYYKIALTIMTDKASKYAHTDFSGMNMKSDDKYLEKIRNIIRKFAETEGDRIYDLNKELGHDEAKRFRHKYLHMSFDYYAFSVPITWDNYSNVPEDNFIRRIIRG